MLSLSLPLSSSLALEFGGGGQTKPTTLSLKFFVTHSLSLSLALFGVESLRTLSLSQGKWLGLCVRQEKTKKGGAQPGGRGETPPLKRSAGLVVFLLEPKRGKHAGG